MRHFSPHLIKSGLTIRRLGRQNIIGIGFFVKNLALKELFERNHILNCCAGVSSKTAADAGKQAYEIRKKKNDQKSNESVISRKRSCMDTVLSHAGLPLSDIDSSHNEPLAPPLHLESTYTRPPSGDYFNKEDGGNGWVYSRMGNPTRNLLEDTLKELELSHSSRAQNCSSEAITCAFSSGMAAASAVVLALPQPLHILLPNDIYHGVPAQLKGLFLQRGVTYASIEMTNIKSIEDEILSAETDNILVWMESPSNPGCKVTDIETVCKLTSQYKKNGWNVTTVVDSTWAPPTLTQPLLVRLYSLINVSFFYMNFNACVIYFSIARGRHSASLGNQIFRWALRCIARCSDNVSTYILWEEAGTIDSECANITRFNSITNGLLADIAWIEDIAFESGATMPDCYGISDFFTKS